MAGGLETEQDAQARYESIAKDLIEVVYNPNEKPLFSGPLGRAKTVDVILAVSSFESGFRQDVDFGSGHLAKGDGGQSWCLMQVKLGPARANGKTAQRLIVNPDGSFTFTTDPTKGYGGEDLVSDRKNCFRAGLSILRASFNMCGQTELKDKLRAYASGACDKGQPQSRLRMGLAIRWMDQKAPPLDDNGVINLMNPPPAQDEVTTASFVLPLVLDREPNLFLLRTVQAPFRARAEAHWLDL